MAGTPDPPPPPWVSRGEMWFGLLPVRRAPELPPDLRPLGGRHRIAVGVVRYREGTLRYDELALGPLVRRGRRAGLLISRMWVDDPVSVRGGREIWGLPKEPAVFDWSADGTSVTVRDAGGLLAGITFGPARRATGVLPSLPLPLPGFGGEPGRRLFVPGRVAGRPRREALTVTAWSDRLPPLRHGRARPALAVRPFRMAVPAAVPC
ncbi:acetoacetate decarboxylase family protein [Streptomyces zingiberis]|uniref:Acetoacetate decarboxylase family protein n=1 Tax=Streptomyces zingiberis TaxID=2053010 RepID=A0ABX1BRM7_9ACTN|nr:acetoacetate decarboxylase family protein [Streptomyces zingiberis]NJQ00390.1 acetoacetate decarboxylase family protein [Streptomyces zingiberis]